jgi:hypothetical protein
MNVSRDTYYMAISEAWYTVTRLRGAVLYPVSGLRLGRQSAQRAGRGGRAGLLG